MAELRPLFDSIRNNEGFELSSDSEHHQPGCSLMSKNSAQSSSSSSQSVRVHHQHDYHGMRIKSNSRWKPVYQWVGNKG